MAVQEVYQLEHTCMTEERLFIERVNTECNGPRNALLNETGTIRAVREDEYIIVGTAGRNDETRSCYRAIMMAFSLEPGKMGHKAVGHDLYAATRITSSQRNHKHDRCISRRWRHPL